MLMIEQINKANSLSFVWKLMSLNELHVQLKKYGDLLINRFVGQIGMVYVGILHSVSTNNQIQKHI